MPGKWLAADAQGLSESMEVSHLLTEQILHVHS